MSTVRPRGRSKGQQRSSGRGCKTPWSEGHRCETGTQDAACGGGGHLPLSSSCSWSSDFAPGTADTPPQRHASRMPPAHAVRETTLDKATRVSLIPGSFPPPRSIGLVLSQVSLLLGTAPSTPPAHSRADEAGPTRGSALRWDLGNWPLQYHKPWRKRNHLSLGLKRPPLPPPRN